MTRAFVVDNAIIPKEIESGIMLGLGGAALAALSSLLPESVKPIGVVGGIALAGLGVYNVFDYFFGTPDVKEVEIPAQKKNSMALVTGRILKPPPGGSAELSSVFSAMFKHRSYEVQFQISNPNTEELVIPIEFRVEEHKTVLPDATSRVIYKIVVPGTGTVGPAIEPSRKLVTGTQPIVAVLMGGISATAQLILKGPSDAEDRLLDTIGYSI